MNHTLPRKISKAGYDVTPLPAGMVRALAEDLDPIDRSVACDSGTEPAFSGRFWDEKENGTYVCVVCGLPLFTSATKFDSGSGWPSYYEPIDPEHTIQLVDKTHGMLRTEVRCARSGTHLGHVFEGEGFDTPTDQRYCINGISLDLQPVETPADQNG